LLITGFIAGALVQMRLVLTSIALQVVISKEVPISTLAPSKFKNILNRGFYMDHLRWYLLPRCEKDLC